MFTWSFSNQKNRSPMWYLIGLILVGSFALFGFFTKLYLLSVVVILFSGTYLLIENNSEAVIQVQINEKQLLLNQASYMWQDFSTFHVVEAQGRPIFLRFFPNKRLSTFLDVPLTEEVDVEVLKQFLLQVFPEGKSTEISKTDTLIHLSKI